MTLMPSFPGFKSCIEGVSKLHFSGSLNQEYQGRKSRSRKEHVTWFHPGLITMVYMNYGLRKEIRLYPFSFMCKDYLSLHIQNI